MTDPELDETARQLWQRIADYQEQVAIIQAEIDADKSELRQLLSAGTYTYQGRPVLRLTQARKFNAEAAAAVLPAPVVDACRVITLDAKALRRNLSEAEAEAFMVPDGRPRVSLL